MHGGTLQDPGADIGSAIVAPDSITTPEVLQMILRIRSTLLHPSIDAR